MAYKFPGIPNINQASLLSAVRKIKEAVEVLTGQGGPSAHSAILRGEGTTGYFDDGVNFRVTVENGIVTDIQDSQAAGHG